MANEEIVVNLMPDGSIAVFGPEPSATELRLSLVRFFDAMNVTEAVDKAEAIRELLKGTPSENSVSIGNVQ